MAKEKKVEEKIVMPQAVSKRCPLHGVRLVHMEVEGLGWGWQCPVEGCPTFIPDPVV